MSELFGIIAVFDEPEAIKRAAADLRQAGFEALEAYTPYPIGELTQIIHPVHRPILPLAMFVAAISQSSRR